MKCPSITLLAAGLALAPACRPPTVGNPAPANPDDPEEQVPPTDPIHELPDTAVLPHETGVDQVPDDTADHDDNSEDWLYDPTQVYAFHLDLSDQAISSLRRNPFNYVEGTFVHDGESWPVGVRIKGQSTYRSIDQKPSLKIKFNFTDPKGEFSGLHHLTVHAMIYDPSMMSEYLAYFVVRASGNPAPRIGYATMEINDTPYGLYAIIESMDGKFIDQWWPDDNDGSLYESAGCDFSNCRCFGVEEEGTEDDREDLNDLCDAMNNQRGDALVEAMHTHFGKEGLFDYLALEAVLAHWDGYSLNVNNWLIYHAPQADTWHMSPWSMDLAWAWSPWSGGMCGNYGDSPSEYRNGQVPRNCNSDPGCKDELLDHYLSIAQVLADADIPAMADANYDRISKYVFADTKREYDDGQFERQVKCIKDWTTERITSIPEYVAGQR